MIDKTYKPENPILTFGYCGSVHLRKSDLTEDAWNRLLADIKSRGAPDEYIKDLDEKGVKSMFLDENSNYA